MRTTLLLILSFAALYATAQSAEQVAAFDKDYKYELYRPYPVENIDAELTPAPKGYKPFYMSHLARHGSRWHSSSKTYNFTLNALKAADKAGELTALGKRYLADMEIIAADAKNRSGELSPVGFEQHRGLAKRMVDNYPEIFHKNSYIDCRSTIVPRCILSMASAVRQITSMVPSAKIRMESSESNTYLKAYGGLNAVKDEAERLSDSLQVAYMPDIEPFLSRIFTKTQDINKSKFAHYSFLMGAILGSTPVEGVDNLDYLFTEEERAAIWRASNIRRYALTGPSKPFGEVIISGIYPFVENVITTADRAIATGDEQATLRFAHDVTVIPFSAILGIQCANTVTDDWDNVSYKWRINEVTPMAANIQMVFYRSKKSDEILVKILHNEREQILDSAVATPVESVYYRWSDIRSYLLSKIK
ncbi:MAG: histidine-type phosphatase [Alistipes sp.]|nr:histidine-type phosphatase [Alistipes sp.]